MSYHIINIDSPKCVLTCCNKQLICRTDDGERQLPIEDIASIIITSFSASLHSQLLLEVAKHGVSVIICEKFRPVSLVLPVNRSTDTLLTRALLTLSPSHIKQLWKATVDAKCHNQFLLAGHLAHKNEHLTKFQKALKSCKTHKEAVCARFFWKIYGHSQNAEKFVRDSKLPGLNSLLNYGYAVLLSSVLQKLIALGLDPTYGIAHTIRERSVPLAYDLMEPFRPCVDYRIAQWIKQQSPSTVIEVTPEFRRWIIGFLLELIDYQGLKLKTVNCIEGVVRSFRRAVLHHRPTCYKPWTPKNSKWVG